MPILANPVNSNIKNRNHACNNTYLAEMAILPNPPNRKIKSELFRKNSTLQKLNSRQIAMKKGF